MVASQWAGMAKLESVQVSGCLGSVNMASLLPVMVVSDVNLDFMINKIQDTCFELCPCSKWDWMSTAFYDGGAASGGCWILVDVLPCDVAVFVWVPRVWISKKVLGRAHFLLDLLIKVGHCKSQNLFTVIHSRKSGLHVNYARKVEIHGVPLVADCCGWVSPFSNDVY